MIGEKIGSQSKLYKFMSERGLNRRSVRFDDAIWQEALEKLAHLNRPEYYFDFEDRLIEEIVVAMVKFPPNLAKEQIINIKDVVEKDVPHDPHVKPFIMSVRMSVKGAVAAALSSLG